MKILSKHFFIFLIIICVLIFYNIIEITCPFRIFFGIACPTCGMYRSFLSLMQLDFKAYFFYNPITIPVVIAIFLAFHRKLFSKHKKLIDFIIIFISLITLLVYLFRTNCNLIP